MKTLILLIAFLNVGLSINNAHANIQYCEWMSHVAQAVAENRNNGMSEFDLIDNYLEQSQNYSEQQAVLSLIDRVYQMDVDSSADDIAFVEKERCELAMLSISKIQLR